MESIQWKQKALYFVTNKWRRSNLEWLAERSVSHFLKTMPWCLQDMRLCSFRRGHMSVSGFQGNWRPPACSAELCSIVKSRSTPFWFCPGSYHGVSPVSPAIPLRFQAFHKTAQGWEVWQPDYCLVLERHCKAGIFSYTEIYIEQAR